MKKRVVAMVLLLVFALGIPAYAAESRAIKATPSLSFNGTTANCSAFVSEVDAEIEATLTLFSGISRIGEWSDSGTSYVYISESCEVVAGEDYWLVVSGTVDGVPFSSSTSGTCDG